LHSLYVFLYDDVARDFYIFLSSCSPRRMTLRSDHPPFPLSVCLCQLSFTNLI
jgi:hypothetical protein